MSAIPYIDARYIKVSIGTILYVIYDTIVYGAQESIS